jgi:hypothetical protein
MGIARERRDIAYARNSSRRQATQAAKYYAHDDVSRCSR